MNTPYQSAAPHLHRFHVFHRLLHVVAALALCLSLFPPLRLDARETAATLTQSTGTVTLTVDALAASEVMASSTLPLFKMTGSYSGNSENRRVKVNDFWLNFEASPEAPLDSAQLNALLSNLSVYRDDGDLSFNPATDTPIVTTDSLVVANGYLHFVLPDNAVTFSDSAYEAQPTYFVVARIAPTAATATPHQFIATFTNDGAYKPNCQDVLDLTPIAPELPPGVATGLVTLVADTSPLQPGPIFTVNSAADDDGTWCTANNCTLRAAINAANMHPNGANRDEIHFLIPGAGIQTIHPQAQLPGLDDTVILDGYTQPGAQPNSSETGNDMVVKIELRGDTAAASSGLTLYAPDIIVQGLAIAGYAYGMSGGVQPNALLFGNRIGTDATGSVAIPGTLVGIYLVNAYTPAIVGNQIAGATETAIVLDRGAYAVLQANLIGTNATGDAVLGNSGDGIALNEHYNAQVTANVIGGVGYGLRLRGAATVETTILQNAIGVNTTGGAGVALPNRGYGIWIAPESGTGTPSTVLIGNDAGGMNAIANSGLAGIRIESGQRITIRGTTIISSGGLGIDIGAPGPQPNDLLDADTGPNALQNFPVIDSAVENDGTVITGHISSTPNTELRIDAYVNSRCNPSSYGEGATWAGSFVVTTDVEGYAAFSGGLSGNGAFITAIATDPAGNSSEFSRCLSSGDAANNDTWPRAMPLALTADASGALTNVTNQYLSMPSQSRWYKLAVQPGSQVIVNLRDLPDNYDVVLYRDIAAAYNKLTAPTNPNLVQLGAQFAPDMFSPDMFSPDMFSPDMFSPDMFSPDMFSPDMFSPDMFSPDMFSPEMFSPDMFSPDMFSPDMFSPDMFSPDMFSPDMFSPDMFSPDMFSSAQTTSMFKVSGSNGRSDELIVANTWNETGDFYIRVRGRNGVYNFATPFTLQTTLVTGTCANVSTDLPATTLTATAGNSQTIILTDLARMQGSDEEKATLLTKLRTLAARPEVMGAVVDVGADARVAAANAQADTYYQCPFAKNLVAASIKKVIDAYRPLNPNLKYVVLVGNDQVIPFVRHPDQAQLANESGYVPPVLNATSSQASLRMGFFLSQDDYGAQTTLNLLAASIPLPDLAVGRLVETASDVNAYLDAYLGTTNGVVNPTTALVTGYDFLSDAADAVKNELAAGLAAPIDTLIADRSWSPADSRSWTADKLRAQLLTNRHDLIYLAGHFSAGSTLAADYTTRVMASEVASSTVDLRNAVVFSSGCHSGYSVVNDHAVPNVTPNPDWAQTFNRKGAALIAGSGYQYGDSDFVEYGERLYLEFAQQLRAQAGPVAIGPALYRAKQQYLEDTGSETTGIYQKQLLIATLFGLPMLSVDLPGAPVVPPTTTSIVTTLTPYTTAPGSILNLNATNVSVDLNRTVSLASKVLTNTAAPNQTITASYLVGPDGVALKPNEPVLPRAVYDVTVPGTVLRGVGFLGGSYADHANIVPLVSTPATELGAVRSLFRTNYFYPVRLWNTNYFAVLKDPLNGTTRLTLTPAQYLSQTADANNGTLRQYKDLQLRLFYSNNTQRYGNNVPALAAAPAIQSIELVTDGGQVVIRARVTGDPSAGIQEVWTTYTALSGSRYGQWQSLKLIQNSVDSTLWEGTLPLNGDDASNLRFMFQAVNGVGLVTMLTNQGSYYIPNQVAAPGSGIVPPPPATLAFANPPTTGAYGTMVTVKAILRNGGTPLANQAVVFALGGQTQTAQTNTLGEASATLKVLNTVGNYALRANFIGDATYGGATTSVSFNVVPQATTLTLDPVSATIDLTVDSGMVATLKDSLGNPIRDKTVVVIVSNATDNTTIVGITDYLGRVRVGTITLPEGAYTVAAYFSGEIPFPTGAQLLSDDRYAPAIAQGTLVVDVTAPTTTATLSGTPALDCGTNCFQGNVILTFTTSEAATTQYRVQSPGGSFGAWRTYSGPVTLSDAGTSTVEFFSTDLVRHVEGTQQVLVQIQHTVIEPALTAVLDTFNRSNGALKLNWYGEGLGGYAIRRTAVEVFGGGAIYWNPRADFGVNQEAYFTFTTVHSSAREQDLLLKVQGGTRPDWRKGAIEVLYDVVHGAVRVETFRPGLSAWTIYPNIPAVYLPGDQIRGRALSNGTVRIYRNNELIGTVTLNPNDQAFFNSKSGRIGTWFIGGSGARFDNFGGGTLP